MKMCVTPFSGLASAARYHIQVKHAGQMLWYIVTFREVSHSITRS
jgi:hypothetical protein